MPPIDVQRYRDAADAALTALPAGARFGPNAAPRVLHALSALGAPALLVSTTSGFSVEILVAAGLDLGRTSFAGHPVSWGTPLDAAWPPVGTTGGADWLRRWHGGLVTTCGLRNVGAPSAEWGLHGDYIFHSASDVAVRHIETDGRPSVTVTGTVWDGPALGTVLELRRTVVVFDDAPEIRVVDLLANRGPGDELAPFLYHVNIGSPMLSPGTVVAGLSDLVPRDVDSAWTSGWPAMGSPESDETELVAEATPANPGAAAVVNAEAGVELRLQWSADTLPRTHVWRRRRGDAYVLAIEPANCSLLGREHEQSTNPLAVIPAHSQRTTWITLSLNGLPTTNGADGDDPAV